MRVLLAADQAACLIITGQNDFTLSGWAYLQRKNGGKNLWANLIDRFFYWHKNHCLNAFIYEWNESSHLEDKWRKQYEEACQEREALR